MEAFLHGTKKHTSVSTGQALFRGENLLEASKRRLRALRGSEIAMIFQDPMTSLNPVLSVGSQLVEAVMLHRDVTSREARDRAIEGLREVGIPRAEKRIDDHPHQFSGGMRQRVDDRDGAAVNEPALLIADEPTTALDVTTQAQILGLIRELQATRGTAVVLITHDLGVVAETADDIVVMYARGWWSARLSSRSSSSRPPVHVGLLASLPRLDVELERLSQIRGQPPSLLRPPAGCRFGRAARSPSTVVAASFRRRRRRARSRAPRRVPARRGAEARRLRRVAAELGSTRRLREGRRPAQAQESD